VLALSACGAKGGRQDLTEPSGTFPVAIVTADFPKRQHIGETLDLRLGVRNAGQQTIPNLAITIFVDPDADRPFSIRSDQPGLANPNRAVWVLQNDYPKLAGSQAQAGATTATKSTFQFGALAPGESREAIWRVSPIIGGAYTLNYRIDAGLQGKAKATTQDGGEATGKFAVTISTDVPQTGVDDKGRVITVGKR
jgi:hypothetical protein